MRILMLGNSLTTANGLPDLLSQRLDAHVVVHARGGARLSEHLNPKTKLGERTQAALLAGGWDYLVLQEMSNGPVRFRDRFLESAEALARMAHASHAVPVLYATWAHAPNCPKLEKLGIGYEQMHEGMHAAALDAVQAGNMLLADVGQTFYRHAERPALYAPDGVHPSIEGTHVAVEVLAQAIEGAQPAAPERPYTVYLLQCEDGSYYAGITTDMDRRLQEHLSGGPKAARYTRTHPVLGVAATWSAPDRATASRMEYRLKQLTHKQKAALAQDPSLFEASCGRDG